MRPMATSSRSGPAAPGVLRAAAMTAIPAMVRGLTSPAAQRRTRALLGALRRGDRLERLPFLLADSARHPLSPAAVRIERTRGRDADQTAVTVWFQEGPQLPALDSGGAPRRGAGHSALRIGAGVLGMAALAAATTAAARLQSDQPRVRVVPASAAEA